MIYVNIAYASKDCKNNIGCAYNKFMECLPSDDDWGCFLDHDAMFTTNDYMVQMHDIIKRNPNIGAFGARTNRVGYSWQLVGNIDIDNHDIKYHRAIGKHLQTKYYDRLSCGASFQHPKSPPSKFSGFLIKQPRFSGTLILVKKATWKKINGFKTNGFLEVDDDFRRRLAIHKTAFAIMDGVYVYHWYRADKPYKTSASMLRRVKSMYNKFIKKNKFDLDKITLLR